MPCIPPETAVSGTVSPRKRFPAPLTAASHADIQRIVNPAGSFPDSVIPHGRTAYAGERIAPLFTITIPPSERGSKRGKRSEPLKNSAGRRFFRGGQVCCTSFERRTGETAFPVRETVPPQAGSRVMCPPESQGHFRAGGNAVPGKRRHFRETNAAPGADLGCGWMTRFHPSVFSGRESRITGS